MIVVDTSAILANLFREPGGEAVLDHLSDAAISSVNLAEIVTKLCENGWSVADAVAAVEIYGVKTVDFDAELAIEAGALRMATRRQGLSLGDRACLALARRAGATALTAERRWAELEIDVKIELIR